MVFVCWGFIAFRKETQEPRPTRTCTLLDLYLAITKSYCTEVKLLLGPYKSSLAIYSSSSLSQTIHHVSGELIIILISTDQ